MAQGEVTGDAQLEVLISTLEKAVRAHPRQFWRYELLVSAYVARAKATSNLGAAAKALRAADRIRTQLATLRHELGPDWEGGRAKTPSELTTVAFKTDDPTASSDAVAAIPAKRSSGFGKVAVWVCIPLALAALYGMLRYSDYQEATAAEQLSDGDQKPVYFPKATTASVGGRAPTMGMEGP